jgi:hypothetical protein
MAKAYLRPIEEYYRDIDNRVSEATLSVGGLYTVIYKLRGSTLPSAVRYPTSLVGMSGESLDAQQVHHIGLDDDLQPVGKPFAANIHDGILNFDDLVTPSFLFRSSLGEQRTEYLDTGYFLDYSQSFGVDQELRAVLSVGGLVAATR